MSLPIRGSSSGDAATAALSSRGQLYAESGLMNNFMRKKAPGEICFSHAENYLMHDDLFKFISSNYKFDVTQCLYNEGPNGPRRLREAMASHLNDYFSPVVPVTAEDVTFAAGITALNEAMAFNLTDEGEGILLAKPIYQAFYGDLVTRSGCKAVYVPFDDVDQFSVDSVRKYEEALVQAEEDGVKVKALLLANPHNPTGKCYPVETLRAFFHLCAKYDLHLISDEIYALSVFDNEEAAVPFTSALAINASGLLAVDRIHVLYGMSKDFGAAGLRLGCLVSKNETLNRAARALGRFHWPSEPSCAIASTILENKPFVAAYTKKSRALLARNYKLATAILDEAKIGYVKNGNAGFFIWIDLSPYLPPSSSTSTSNSTTEKEEEFPEAGWASEQRLTHKLLRAGVSLSSGHSYRAERPGWFRVVFSVEEEVLQEGLRRIIEAVKGT